MEILLIVLKVLLIISCIAAIVVVLMQDSSSDGLSGVIGGGNSDSFFGKNKGKTLQAKLTKWTIAVAIVFAVLVVAVDLIISLAK